jgi:DNA ligase-1
VLVIDTALDQCNGVKVAADWVRDLESSDSRLYKEGVIEKALVASRIGSTGAQCFLYNCYLAYHPFFVYNVRQVPETVDLVDRENPWVEFWGMLEGLRTRSVTGNRARDAIDAMSKRFDSTEWNGLARRVIIKDLRCGVTDKTLNKVLKKTAWAIPIFECQLAQDSTDQPNKMIGRKRLECKLDGVRVIAMVYKSGTVNLFSRNGKAFVNFPHIEQQLAASGREMGIAAFGRPTDFVLDGEIIGDSFQALMKQAHRKRDADASDSNYYIFDIMPREDFARGFWNTPQNRRIELLETMRVAQMFATNIHIMPGMEVDLGTAEGHSIMRQFADASVKQGYEGIMIKSVDAPYESKRSSFWMKWKPTITVDLTIVGFEEGTGRNAGRLGAIIFEGVDNDRTIRVNVGTGYSDDDRSRLWAARPVLLGQISEIQADAVTQNQDGSYSLRFPRFLRFRGFDAGEKL